jgi:hypothetical protein
MGGYVLHAGARVVCEHTPREFPPGSAAPATPNPLARVRVSGQPAVLLPELYVVTGCIHPPPSSPPTSPCLTARWTSGAKRVTSMGQPLVLTDSDSLTIPNNAKLASQRFQTRVKAL